MSNKNTNSTKTRFLFNQNDGQIRFQLKREDSGLNDYFSRKGSNYTFYNQKNQQIKSNISKMKVFQKQNSNFMNKPIIKSHVSIYNNFFNMLNLHTRVGSNEVSKCKSIDHSNSLYGPYFTNLKSKCTVPRNKEKFVSEKKSDSKQQIKINNSYSKIKNQSNSNKKIRKKSVGATNMFGLKVPSDNFNRKSKLKLRQAKNSHKVKFNDIFDQEQGNESMQMSKSPNIYSFFNNNKQFLKKQLSSFSNGKEFIKAKINNSNSNSNFMNNKNKFGLKLASNFLPKKINFSYIKKMIGDSSKKDPVTVPVTSKQSPKIISTTKKQITSQSQFMSKKPSKNQVDHLQEKKEIEIMPLKEENIKKYLEEEELEKLRKYITDHQEKYHEIPPTTPEFYRFGKLLGRGAYGKVNLCVHKFTNQLVAIKSIKKELLKDELSMNKVMQEYSILKLTRHKSIIK